MEAQGVRRRRAAPSGAGGKSKAKAPKVRAPYEAPDTLTSNAIGRLWDAICEGPIEGLVGGAKGIYVDETPVENPDGSRNFNSFAHEFREGTEDQDPIRSGSGVESETTVGVRVKNGSPVTRQITTPGLDHVRVNISYAGMIRQNPKNGDRFGSTVRIAIAARTVGDPWPAGQEHEITGKTSDRFSYSFMHRLPATEGPWEVRVTRITPDANGTTEQNDTYWDSFTEITSANLAYPFTAHAMTTFRADEFSQIPSTAYLIDGLRIKVPTNYSPEDADTLGTGAYSGPWDGLFKIAFSNNPAWVLYDLLTNERYGLGQHVKAANLDKWALYRIGRMCDELVESGDVDDFGSPRMERRFAMNLVLSDQAEAYQVVSEICSAFRGMAYWSSGLITFSQDVPRAPVAQFASENVKDGNFNYSSTSRRSRHTVVTVRWNDPANLYRPEVEYVDDPEAIARYGDNRIEVTAIGCTSRGQAQRLGRYTLLTEQLETETVQFVTGLEGKARRPGDVIDVLDQKRGAERVSGRIRGAAGIWIELDQEITLDPAKSYDLTISIGSTSDEQEASGSATSLVLPADVSANDPGRIRVHADVDGDGSFETACEVRGYDGGTRTVTIGSLSLGGTVRYRIDWLVGLMERPVIHRDGAQSVVQVSTPFGVPPEAGQVFILTSPNTVPKPYRVLAVVEQDRIQHEIHALEYRGEKFAQIESGLRLETQPPPGTFPESDLVPAPPVVSITPEVRVGPAGPRSILAVTWSPPAEARIRAYFVRWRLNLGNWQNVGEVYGLSYEILDARPGRYDVEVLAITVREQRSTPGTATFEFDEQSPVEQSRVTGLRLFGQSGVATESVGPDFQFEWRWNAPGGSVEEGGTELGTGLAAGAPAWFLDFDVKVIEPATNRLLRTDHVVDPRYTYTLAMNAEDGGPRRAIRLEVAVRDLFFRTSPATQITVSNPSPPRLEQIRAVGGFRDVWFYFKAPTDLDWRGVLIWAGTTPDFVPTGTTVGEGNCVWDGASSPAVWDAATGTRFYVRAAAYDAFSRDPSVLNVSDVYTVDTVRIGQFDHEQLSIRRGVLQDLTVDTAQINDLAVRTIKIAGNAVTLFETVHTSSIRTIVAHDGSGEADQGEWCAIATVRLATLGGPVRIEGLLYAQVVHVSPNVFGSSYVGVEYGQKLPRVRYRVVRTEVTPPGSPSTVFESGITTISATGYGLAGVVTRVDGPPPGLWDYQLQVRWENDVYDFGTATYGSIFGDGSTGFAEITGIGGTRWLSNAFDTDPFYISDGAGGWDLVGYVDVDRAGSWSPSTPDPQTDTKLLLKSIGAGPGEYPVSWVGAKAYEIRRAAATQLKIDLHPQSFLTGMEFRR